MENNNILSNLNLRIVIDTIPTAIFIIDDETRVLDLNNSASQLIGKEKGQVLFNLCGEMLHCFNAKNSTDGCGTTEFCPDCVVRNTIKEACAGNTVVKRRADLLIQKENDKSDIVFSVSASPLKHDEKTLSVFSMEDITEIVLMQKLIPICSHCKSVRNDNEYWETIEQFLNRKNGFNFSHGICPDCVEKFYPDLKPE